MIGGDWRGIGHGSTPDRHQRHQALRRGRSALRLHALRRRRLDHRAHRAERRRQNHALQRDQRARAGRRRRDTA